MLFLQVVVVVVGLFFAGCFICSFWFLQAVLVVVVVFVVNFIFAGSSGIWVLYAFCFVPLVRFCVLVSLQEAVVCFACFTPILYYIFSGCYFACCFNDVCCCFFLCFC